MVEAGQPRKGAPTKKGVAWLAAIRENRIDHNFENVENRSKNTNGKKCLNQAVVT